MKKIIDIVVPAHPPASNVMHEEADPYLSLITDYDVELFKNGTHYRMYEKLGAHIVNNNGIAGTCFAVWAPNARYVSVTGNFNGWNRGTHAMRPRWDSSGIWELFVEGIGEGEYYKYYIESYNGYTVEKADPYGVHYETPPATASVVWDASFKWTDKKWMQQRAKTDMKVQPLSVYEVHIGSWRRAAEENNRYLTYRELAAELPAYCNYMGFTHVEFMPVMQHPFYGSWGYQVSGYFAPDSRYGTPPDFKFLVNELHKAGVGVLLDWVPSHFPTDAHALGYFDGSNLYEHADPRKGFHNDWQSLIFNYGRNEVKAFLISNALYWLREYHIDGLRVDAVSSMLYLDYSRKHGEWEPNEFGGRENLDAVRFIQELNTAVHLHEPGAITIAEESTAWQGVTKTVEEGGLGFDMKWMMGWMHDTLRYMQKDPVYRKFHQSELIFSIYYAFTEKFVLPLSHDEVVYGKYSLIDKMPGDKWQQFANLRLLYTYMYGHPGSKLLFMGGEFAQHHEWRHDFSLDWNENNDPMHTGIQTLIKDLNALYRSEPALYETAYNPAGFEWIANDDAGNSVICWTRKNATDHLLFIANFTPGVLHNYRVGVPEPGYYTEVLNSDDARYEGSNCLNGAETESYPVPMHGKTHSLPLTLPPLGVVVLKKSSKDYYGMNLKV